MTQADAALMGDPDRDFIALMIPHHQGAVDMARAVVLHGTDPALKNIAQEVIAEQTIEIEYLQKILARLDAAPAPAAHPAASAVEKSDWQFVANEQPAAPVDDRTHDRVYTGDQVSNTVSVIDPAQNKLLGLIKLGELPPGGPAAALQRPEPRPRPGLFA